MGKKSDRVNECFEVFYGYGPGRTLMRLERDSGISLEVLTEWREAYAWDEKIRVRESDLKKAIEEKFSRQTDRIRNKLTDQISRLVEGMGNHTLGLPFEIRNSNDLRQVAQAYYTLVQANALARKAAIDVSGGSTPTTWHDLLEQSGEESTQGLGLEDLKETGL